jgi:hypothetical protein
MDLVRTLLLKVEEEPIDAGCGVGLEWHGPFFEIEGWDRDTAIKHFELLVDAGFIKAPDTQGMTEFVIRGLTWEGHEFIDTIRSPEVWKKTKAGMKAVGGIGLDLMVQLAKAEGKRLLAERFGISL